MVLQAPTMDLEKTRTVDRTAQLAHDQRISLQRLSQRQVGIRIRQQLHPGEATATVPTRGGGLSGSA